jgi:hypothetical protein
MTSLMTPTPTPTPPAAASRAPARVALRALALLLCAGLFAVGTTTFDWVDSARGREVITRLWFPIEAGSAAKQAHYFHSVKRLAQIPVSAPRLLEAGDRLAFRVLVHQPRNLHGDASDVDLALDGADLAELSAELPVESLQGVGRA